MNQLLIFTEDTYCGHTLLLEIDFGSNSTALKIPALTGINSMNVFPFIMTSNSSNY